MKSMSERDLHFNFNRNNDKLKRNFFKNSKSQSNYTFSNLEFQDKSTIYSNVIRNKTRSNFSIIAKNNESKYSAMTTENNQDMKAKLMLEIYGGTFYIRLLKSKKYLKEINNILIYLNKVNDFYSPNSEYKKSVSNFPAIYQDK